MAGVPQELYNYSEILSQVSPQLIKVIHAFKFANCVGDGLDLPLTTLIGPGGPCFNAHSSAEKK
jgi:hypothetical protein